MKLFAAVAIVLAGLGASARTQAGEHPAPAPTKAPVQLDLAPKVQVTLTALDRLAQFGYVVNTPARALKAIKHWQKVNGLQVDGIVGPITLASLGLDRPAGTHAGTTAVTPAVRQTPPVSAGDPAQIIRDVWPDDLEDHALAIATRESNLQPGARNACCYGLFQIHFAANRPHLAELGITSPSQLLDARTNAEAALHIYELSGWAPWACHGQCQDIP